MTNRIFVQVALRCEGATLLTGGRENGWLPEAELAAGRSARPVATELATRMVGQEVAQNDLLLWQTDTGMVCPQRGRHSTIIYALPLTERSVPGTGTGRTCAHRAGAGADGLLEFMTYWTRVRLLV